ncbi:ankyrin repeat-containing domain protein [Aspergillus parasiticus]|uniref:Ankyrin repeat-containing domain protein n=1 Tax=Aspergillus parasiticus TaxID=5067 RepID=A0A5N6DGH6_ASPPA|nr:ankyrin repeat-containing domain protein [Aspergillus parasiticus]
MFSKPRIPGGLQSGLKKGHLSDVQKYLDAGISPNLCDKENKQSQERPLLVFAAINDHVHIIELLLKYGAKVDKIDTYGRTALSWAAEYGALDALKLLIEHGANINAEDKEWTTPLAWVAHAGTGDTQAVHDYLISNGAKIEMHHSFLEILKHSLAAKCNWALFRLKGKSFS